jgi:hypothetical protein
VNIPVTRLLSPTGMVCSTPVVLRVLKKAM